MELAADRIEWAAGIATASGHVVVVDGDQRLIGERAELTPDVLCVYSGTYSRPDGEVAFDEAEIGLQDGAGRLVRVHARFAGATLDAETLFVGQEWRAEDAILRPCACDDGRPAALDFAARFVVVEPGKVAILKGGSVRIFSLPVLPVPYWREPLDPKRLRLLFPAIGLGSDGIFAAQHASFGAAGWRVDGGPAWRQDRGFRGQIDVARAGDAGPVATSGARLQSDVGWDDITDSVRGALATHGGVAAGSDTSAAVSDASSRAAWDVSVVSDPMYVQDYGVDYVSRGVGYRESRATASFSALRGTAWLPDDGSIGDLATLRVRKEFGRAVAFAPSIAFAAVGADPSEVSPRVAMGMDGRASGSFSILHEEASVAGEIVAGAGAIGTRAAVVNRTEVPIWSALGAWRIQWAPGVTVASTSVTHSASSAVEETVAAGPSLRAQTALGNAVVTAEGSVPWDGAAWTPVARATVSVSPLAARVQLDAELQLGEVRLTTPVGGSIGFAHATEHGGTGPLSLAWAALDTHIGRFVGGASSGYDIGIMALSGVGVYAGYDDGCSAAVVTASLSPDRPVPDIGLKVTLRK